MNGLTLRISGTNSKKMKGNLAFNPVVIPPHLINKIVDGHTLFEKFNQSNSVDEQLLILRENLNNHCNEITLYFLVLIFLQTEIKHPVKCFVVRYIMKNDHLQEPFSKALAEEISKHFSVDNIEYKVYNDFIPKLASCIENFPSGAQAIKLVEARLAAYLIQCLCCCVHTLSSKKTLSPTEKNEIFDLTHLTLRLLLHIVQKIGNTNCTELMSHFNAIKLNIKELLFDDDVPMDSKSVCGILFLTMYILENGLKSWCEILNPSGNNQEFSELLCNDSARLSLHSALATVISAEDLCTTTIGDQHALLLLTDNILTIGEKMSSDSTFTLGVTRTLVQISRTLLKCQSQLGLRLVDSLLVFVWAHLEHYMDSVRHLTAQVLGYIVKYCTHLKDKGEEKALDKLLSAILSLDKSRKSYYVSVRCLSEELGAGHVLSRLPAALSHLLAALELQTVQACATSALESLLQRHSRECSSEEMYHIWVQPVLTHLTHNHLHSSVLNILENLLLQAVKLDDNILDYLLPHIKELPTSNENGHEDLKCVLMLLSVVRKSNAISKVMEKEGEWKGLIGYDVLKMAAVNAVDETRILTLSLVVESPKSTESFSVEELYLVLWYLRYNINAQAPNLRQLTLSLMKKFMKRLEDSYKVLKRQNAPNVDSNKSDYYLTFLEDMREFCYKCLVTGANYSRRYVALQLLDWTETIGYEGYHRTWKSEYIDNLLQCLEDSYESNKVFALEILQTCPQDLLESQRIAAGMDMESILRQTSSMKPPDCVSAAYKLRLFVARLPHILLQGYDTDVPECVRHAALRRLLHALAGEVRACERSVVRAARHAHMYGALHCMLHILQHVDTRAISESQQWSMLIAEIVQTCFEVNAAVACVVNNSSPEGHLPMDMSGPVLGDTDNSQNSELDDGKPVTAQMVLLCAWRSVKEVSLVLGCIASRLSIAGKEREHGTLTQRQVVAMGEHFTKLLAETKHRGAFEQAYVGFTHLLARLWRCRGGMLHALPGGWLRDLMATLASEAGGGSLCATRRSAGLPFMIQALVTTELQVSDKPKCFHECVMTLMQLCGGGGRGGGGAVLRAHCCNVLRALVRCSALQQAVAPYVGDALLLALKGFDGPTWEERNSSTLLLSALVVRVFGVARGADAGGVAGGARRSGGGVGGAGGEVHARNRMTGRTFFLRYPQLYDFMLEKLKEANESEECQLLKPSLFPILLLLARLYPSALEGTVSNLKLSRFMSVVCECGGSAVLKTRQLAAQALLPLVSPNMYIPHIEEMLALISDQNIKRNFCHGILLQVTKLLDNRPDNLSVDDTATARLQDKIQQSCWILQQGAGPHPCYLIAEEYNNMINLIVWKFPSLIDATMITKITYYLDIMLSKSKDLATALSGRDLCLASAANLSYVLINKYGQTDDLIKLIYNFLLHDSYEVTLTALNYLLILNKDFEIENSFQEHLNILTKDKNLLIELRKDDNYSKTLYKVFITTKYLECKQKCLKLLSLEENTYKYMIQGDVREIGDDVSELDDDVIVRELTRLVDTQHENLTHIYLYSLTTFLTDKIKEPQVNGDLILNGVRTIFDCSSSRNSFSTRSVVANFLENNFKSLIDLELMDLSEEDKFEVEASLWASLVLILEDDEEAVRRAGARTVGGVACGSGGVASGAGGVASGAGGVASGAGGVACGAGGVAVCARAGEELRALVSRRAHGAALLCVLALLDFNCEVCLPDYTLDEVRVFEQNEKYNVFLEETMWSIACGEALCALEGAWPQGAGPQGAGPQGAWSADVCEVAARLTQQPHYAGTFTKLCGAHLNVFLRLTAGECRSSDVPKIDLFVKTLRTLSKE